MEQDHDLALAFTLAARLCHDLAGTLGALAGSLDMAAGAQDPEAVALALDCARELSAKLRLLRAAWSADSEVPELSSLLDGLPGAERLSIDCAALSKTPDGGPRRLTLNLLLLAAHCLPRGGTIRVAGDDRAMSLDIEGPRARWPEALGRCLADPAALDAATGNTREVGVGVAVLLARQMGRSIVLESDTRLTLTQA